MRCSYLISDEKGDIPVSSEMMHTPFKTTLSEEHRSLTLGDYFRGVESFLFHDRGKAFAEAVAREHVEDARAVEEAREAWIRSEKHGADYHVAGVRVLSGNHELKVCVCTAVTQEAQSRLAEEARNLRALGRTIYPSYLPRQYLSGYAPGREDFGKPSLFMLVGEWLEDYHEWHLAPDGSGNDGFPPVCIWDYQRGCRFSNPSESWELFRQAAMILTRYYDFDSFCEIGPWHHAAGDFVIRSTEQSVDVRLTAVRGYRPLPILSGAGVGDVPVETALFYFFLNMSVRMRLDRVDGVGERLWAEAFPVEAVLAGFLDALRCRERDGAYPPGKAAGFILLLKSFSRDELEKAFSPLVALFALENAAEFTLIHRHLGGHVSRLHQAFQSLP